MEARGTEAVRRLESANGARELNESDEARYYGALVSVFEAQQAVIDQVLQAISLRLPTTPVSPDASDRKWTGGSNGELG